jgi:hypothetical protein
LAHKLDEHLLRGLIKRVTVQVPDGLHQKLKIISVKDDTTMQKLFLEALKLYLQQCENNSIDLD